MGWYDSYYPPYVSVAQRRANAAREVEKLRKTGRVLSPVLGSDGRKLGRTFWGKAWCDHIESFGDFASRLPKGKTYARNGSVIDLQIAAGRIDALVMGSELYTVKVGIDPLPTAAWAAIKSKSAGQIGSLVELLQGKLSNAVMQVVTEPAGGLFPKSREIKMNCSCPDYAGLCKHLAAVLYGVGMRLDDDPALLFKLRGVDEAELIDAATTAGHGLNVDADRNVLDGGDLADVFGIDFAAAPVAPPPADPVRVVATRRTKAAVAARKPKAVIKTRAKTAAATSRAATARSRKLGGVPPVPSPGTPGEG